MWRLLAPTLVVFASLAATQTVTDRTGWTVSVDSFQHGNEDARVLDGNTGTFWHTQFTPTNAALPHSITIDMKKTVNVNGLRYLPRQDGTKNGNIGQHTIEISLDGMTFTKVASGTYLDDSSLKSTPFTTTPARYVRLSAQTEAGGRGPWTSAAEINILSSATYTEPATTGGIWGSTIDFPIVPAAAAVLPTSGKVLMWSSYKPLDFGGGSGSGTTYTAIYDPVTGTVSQRIVTNTQHDMFCPGISLDATGRPFVTGGNDAAELSIYDFAASNWVAGPNMQIARGYQSSATLSNGNIFTIGGSWSGGSGNKNGEVWKAATNTWSLLPGCPVGPMLTADAKGVYRADNHGWLFGWKSGSVFQAGPSKAMNWYTATGTGAQKPAGMRGTDPDAMNGNAIMYDAVNGKILTVGGAPNYQDNDATKNARIITIGTPGTAVSVATVASMAYARAFHNSVVMPDGKVLVVGGEAYPVPFSDNTAVLTPELYNPASSSFMSVNPMSVARTYHSWALLMPDATVIAGGGGLCGGCDTNHPNAQIYTPAYLFNADGSKASRPVINTISATSVAPGATITVSTNVAVTSFSLVRYGSGTHSVNTDQRRIPLTPTATSGTTYTLQLPNDSGIVLPGAWMVFVMNAQGVPSVAKTITVKPA
ncbi:MAG: hypothetical protein LQ343_000098 [Gyalolechia ehrenbergii]|nr:MAG: hypothetical protein LQ343_000098 [Gyalolechia ehrenbergii]